MRTLNIRAIQINAVRFALHLIPIFHQFFAFFHINEHPTLALGIAEPAIGRGISISHIKTGLRPLLDLLRLIAEVFDDDLPIRPRGVRRVLRA